MTRSGKIRRHIFHEMYQLGDTITLADPGIVDILIELANIIVTHCTERNEQLSKKKMLYS